MNVGKKQRGGFAEAEGSGGNAGAQIIKVKRGFGDEEGIKMERQAFSLGGRTFEPTEPTFSSENSDFGQMPVKETEVEFEGDGFDAESGGVLDSPNLELADAPPTGRGKGGGDIGKEEKKMQGDGRKGQTEKEEGTERKKKVATKHGERLGGVF